MHAITKPAQGVYLTGAVLMTPDEAERLGAAIGEARARLRHRIAGYLGREQYAAEVAEMQAQLATLDEFQRAHEEAHGLGRRALTRRDEAEITTAHSVRQLCACTGCGGMGMRPSMVKLAAPRREAPSGTYHGHCVVALLGDKVLELPEVERDKLTLAAMGVTLARKVLDASQPDNSGN